MSQEQIFYISVSIPIVIIFVLLGLLIKKDKWKNIYLTFWAIFTVIIHRSTILQTFFKSGGVGLIYMDHVFPVYFCNFIFYITLLIAFWTLITNKRGRTFNCIATFAAYGGFFGALVNLFFTEPHFETWGLFQSALSHSSMLITSILLFTLKYVKINVYNMVPLTLGLGVSAGVGGIVNLIFYLSGLESPNAMWLLHGPVGAENMNGCILGAIMLGATLLFTILWELITKRKDIKSMWFKTIKDLDLYLPLHRKKPKEAEAK